MGKKLLCILLCFMLVLSLAGCGEENKKNSRGAIEENDSKEPSGSKTDEPTVTETNEPTAEPTKEPTKEPTPEVTKAPERVKLDATEIYKQMSQSVVQLNIYDASGTWTSLGSGFFIDKEGTIITNYHVINGADSIVANDYNDHSYKVTQILGYDEDLDIAYVKVDAKTTPVTLYRDKIQVGETVYTLGSSEGFTGTFSDGIVSTASRKVSGVDCIQITAPISHGNSGGPLINAYGEVIGINSMFYVEGQNLNFAININMIDEIDLSSPVTMEQYASAHRDDTPADTGTHNYTIIYHENDDGMEVYDNCSYIEWEDNNTPSDADELVNGQFMAAYVDKSDLDVFSITVDHDTTLYMAVQPYWKDDNGFVTAALCDEDFMVYTNAEGKELYFTEFDEENEWYYIEIEVPAGTYYIGVYYEDNSKYDWAYYRVGAQWE